VMSLEREVLEYLPRDYGELTKDGKRKARLAILHTQATPDDYVRAWKFFRYVYLLQSGIFYKRFVPSPAYHEQGIRDFATYHLNIFVAPRGGAKSTVFLEENSLLLLLTHPRIVIVAVTSTLSLVEERFDHLMIQLTENDFILHDFGKLRPPRGGGMWSRRNLRLTNQARIVGFPVEGRKRGARPDVVLLDDPEYDPKNEMSGTRLREEFEGMMFRQIFPMIGTRGRLFWNGTFISRASYIYHAATTQDDKRFLHWNRRIIPAAEEQDDGTYKLAWPEYWSRKDLLKLRAQMGYGAYAAEMLNRPVSDKERILRLDPELDTYAVDGEWQRDPYNSQAVLHYVETDIRTGESTPVSRPFGEFMRSLYVLFAVDYAPTVGQFSDFSVIHVMGFDHHDTLWSLDLWQGKVYTAELIARIFKMGEIWRPKVVGIEAVAVQYEIYERVKAELPLSMTGWSPRILPVRYPPNVSKADRCASLQWRFNCHRIKYPRGRTDTPNSAYAALFAQTENFTMDMALLAHDDCLDTVAMVPYIARGRGKRPDGRGDRKPSLMKRTKGGFRRLEAMNASELTPEQIQELLDMEAEEEYTLHREGAVPPPLSETTVME